MAGRGVLRGLARFPLSLQRFSYQFHSLLPRESVRIMVSTPSLHRTFPTSRLQREFHESTNKYLTLKLRVRTIQHNHEGQCDDREIAVSNHLKCSTIEHPGKNMVRKALDSFEVIGPNGNHDIQDDSILLQLEQGEIEQPIARKVLSDRTIYNSRPMPSSAGPPVLCDLGEARVGNKKHRGDIMPGIYRALEIILGMSWDAKVDIWAVGVMTWDFLEGGHLFFAKKGILDDEHHLAEMVALLGPPPAEFLKRSKKCQQYWDNHGNWKGSIPIPDQSFESRERLLNDDDQALFLRFMRRTLRWIPEERPVAEELAFDDFLMQPQVAS
ncbi:MAG: hypothetical protein M1834_003520 [Cirrosporium novae-zelandiae]|nr:MAG: hypothetical protein M1834_003520 [Cirrosporium novae-zelandiae]